MTDQTTIDYLKKMLEDKICPHCDKKYEGEQVGRCVYCEHCGARLYQGRA